MKKRSQKNLCAAIGLLASFVLWTFAVSHLDVQTIGPNGSSVGFAALNGFFHKLTGVHMALYTVTDWLGLVPLCFVLGFALLGLVQLIQRRSIVKVDYSILVIGGFYFLVNTIQKTVLRILAAFTVFMVIGRLISGVHWFTDIVGGALLSAGLVMLYYSVSSLSITKT